MKNLGKSHAVYWQLLTCNESAYVRRGRCGKNILQVEDPPPLEDHNFYVKFDSIR